MEKRRGIYGICLVTSKPGVDHLPWYGQGANILSCAGVAFLKLLTKTLAYCPRVILRAVAQVLARLVLVANGSPAMTTRRNLELCFPDLEPAARHNLVKASLAQTGMLLLESGITFHWPVEKLNSLIGSISGEELLVGSMATGRGTLLLVPHFGNWEFLALFLGRFQLVALYDPLRQQTLDDLVKQARQRTGAKLEPLNWQGLKSAYQVLKAGGLLGLLPDQVPDRSSGVHVPFFNHPALTMTLAHRLIRATDPVVLIASAVRAGQSFDITFEEVTGPIRSENPIEALTAMNQAIESLVLKAPEQYQWEYRRFKSPPEGLQRVY